MRVHYTLLAIGLFNLIGARAVLCADTTAAPGEALPPGLTPETIFLSHCYREHAPCESPQCGGFDVVTRLVV